MSVEQKVDTLNRSIEDLTGKIEALPRGVEELNSRLDDIAPGLQAVNWLSKFVVFGWYLAVPMSAFGAALFFLWG